MALAYNSKLKNRIPYKELLKIHQGHVILVPVVPNQTPINDAITAKISKSVT
jgi:hypothetical protein